MSTCSRVSHTALSSSVLFKCSRDDWGCCLHVFLGLWRGGFGETRMTQEDSGGCGSRTGVGEVLPRDPAQKGSVCNITQSERGGSRASARACVVSRRQPFGGEEVGRRMRGRQWFQQEKSCPSSRGFSSWGLPKSQCRYPEQVVKGGSGMQPTARVQGPAPFPSLLWDWPVVTACFTVTK